ncbi:MAG: translation initiation factor IF-2 [Candidatus Bathyarchaeia archaeon]
MPLRHPIVAVLGHVDHGKTTLLDSIRGTSVAAREPGQITQWIGASMIPAATLAELCGGLLKRYRFQIKVPGLLFIDTPGHETFSNLRKRGGSAADIAILVIDVIEGLKPQTKESLEILRARRVPFIVAANKIDLIPGWKPLPGAPFEDSLARQSPEVRADLENRVYALMGGLSGLGFNSDRYDRIRDFTKTVAIVPVSARTKEGLQDVLSMLIGLTQAFMEKDLMTAMGPARGTVLEVKEEIGLGVTINAIIYDGVLREGDTIVVGGLKGPIATKVRAILVPKPLDEIRDPRDRFSTAREVVAAAGVKIGAPGLEGALPGSSLYAAPSPDAVAQYSKLLEEEIKGIVIASDKEGIVLKADTLGSLEALISSLSSKGIPIRLADIGNVSRRDVVEAGTVKERLLRAVLAFNVKLLPDAEEEAAASGVKIFRSNLVYGLMEEFLEWMERERADEAYREFKSLILPGAMRILPGFVFRRSKPAIVGVEVLGGRVRPGYPLMTEDGRLVGEILRIQDRGKDIEEAPRGMQVAVSIDKPTVGRQISEGDILYVAVPDSQIRALSSKFRERLSSEDLELLGKISEISRGRDALRFHPQPV